MRGPAMLLVVAGLVLAAVGLLLLAGDRFGLGRLPGDFAFRRGDLRVYVPLATSLIASVVLSLLVYLFTRR